MSMEDVVLGVNEEGLWFSSCFPCVVLGPIDLGDSCPLFVEENVTFR